MEIRAGHGPTKIGLEGITYNRVILQVLKILGNEHIEKMFDIQA